MPPERKKTTRGKTSTGSSRKSTQRKSTTANDYPTLTAFLSSKSKSSPASVAIPSNIEDTDTTTANSPHNPTTQPQPSNPPPNLSLEQHTVTTTVLSPPLPRPQPPPSFHDPLDLSTFRHFPSLIVFDLDYTLWPFFLHAHTAGPPFSVSKDEAHVVDVAGRAIKLFPEVVRVIRTVREQRPGTRFAIASRARPPEWAINVLSLLRIPLQIPAPPSPTPTANTTPSSATPTLYSLLTAIEIDPTPHTKIPHLRSIHSTTRIPYESMLFFDDEPRNVRDARTGLG
ncbi:hypothetical protein HK102_003990, partial [Quaeritorhiza haematococci]